VFIEIFLFLSFEINIWIQSKFWEKELAKTNIIVKSLRLSIETMTGKFCKDTMKFHFSSTNNYFHFSSIYNLKPVELEIREFWLFGWN